MKKKYIISIAVLIVALLVYFAFLKPGKEEVGDYRKEAVTRENIQDTVVTTGSLNPVIIVDIGSQVSGRISKLYVDFNSKVKVGQILVELDPELFRTKLSQQKANYSSAEASLEKAKLNLENSKKSHERKEDLYKKELISDEEIETAYIQYLNAQSDLKSAEASLEQAGSMQEQAQVDLNYTIIKSPINGVVINRNINEGQTVASSLQAPVLFQIANDLTQMQVECSVDEADIGRVKEGQKVEFTVDAYPDDSFTGFISQVRYSPVIQSNVVTYTTIVGVENPEMKLFPGMTATVSIITAEAINTLLVPNAALRFCDNLEKQAPRQKPEQTGERPQAKPGAKQKAQTKPADIGCVAVQDENGEFKIIRIRKGVTDNTNTEVVEILDGELKEGDEVITGFPQNINPQETQRRQQSLTRIMRSF